jgi:two-component system, chemotaxis family, chemotaxis protein CheY
MHIGLLEDDKAIQEMLRLVLQDEGYTVTVFPNAEGCLEAFYPVDSAQSLQPFHLLIVDWRLSGSAPGTEVIRTLRSDSSLQKLPIILTTAAAFNNKEELQDLQVTLLEKPFAVDEIASLIKQLVQPKSETVSD